MGAYHWNWGVFFQQVPSGGATYLDWFVQGVEWTLLVSAAGWAIALALGALLGVLRTVPSRALRGFAASYVELFRNVPLLVQLFLWYFVAPELLPKALGDAIKGSPPLAQQFAAGTLCLGLFTAARVCEQVRAGIESLARGQRAAALALGLTLPQAYRAVLLPMAFRIILPPLTSETLNIIKNSSVVSTIGLIELSRQAQQLVDYTAQPYEAFIAVTLAYLAINAIVMFAMRALERRARVPGYLAAAR